MTYHQRLAAAWPDPVDQRPGPAAKPAAKAAPAAPAPEAPPFRELARTRSAAQHARQLLNEAWPDDMPAVAQGQDDTDPDEARAREIRELDAEIELIQARKAKLTGQGKG